MLINPALLPRGHELHERGEEKVGFKGLANFLSLSLSLSVVSRSTTLLPRVPLFSAIF